MLPSATVIKNVLAECRDDYVGLWSIVRRVQTDLADQSQVMETTMALLRKILTEDNITAGNFQRHAGRDFQGQTADNLHGHTFCTWDQPIDQILQKIDTEWHQLGRDPTIGEIVWFTAREGL